jgi:hypothetical protein
VVAEISAERANFVCGHPGHGVRDDRTPTAGADRGGMGKIYRTTAPFHLVTPPAP